MWYFSWILGIGVALAFGTINAMWLETRQKRGSGVTRA
ncbi:cytochrome bd-I oxidase subunit CydX [Burkholderia singularis]|nr:cytochrome bd-I oxidase subunit CydX [Burkholderia singularis]